MKPSRWLPLLLVVVACACGGPRDPAAAVVAEHRKAIYQAIDADVNCEERSDSFFGCFDAEAQLSLQRRVRDATTPMVSELAAVQGSKESLRPLVDETLAATQAVSDLVAQSDECARDAKRVVDAQCESVFDDTQNAEIRLRDVLKKWDRHL